MLKWKGNYGYIGSLCIATVLKKPGAAHFETIYMPVEMVGVYGMESEEVAREVAERDTLEWLKSKGLQPIPEKSDIRVFADMVAKCESLEQCPVPCEWNDTLICRVAFFPEKYIAATERAIAAYRVKLAEGNSNESQRKV